MKIVFRLNDWSQMDLSDQSKELLASLSPVQAADYLQDILCDAMDAYNEARLRCGWEPLAEFVRP